MTLSPHERESVGRRLEEIQIELNSTILDDALHADLISIRQKMLDIVFELREKASE